MPCFRIAVVVAVVVLIVVVGLPFFTQKVWNNDFGVFQKSLEAQFWSGSVPNTYVSKIGQQKYT